MTDRRPTVFWPLGAWIYLVSGIAVALVVFLSTLPKLAWPYQDWVITSAEFHQQNAYAAPLAAGLAALVAGRLTPPSRIFAQPIAARAGWGIAGPQLSLLVGTVLTGYLLGLLPLTVATVRAAEYGMLHPLVAATGVLGLAAATVVGYLVGVLGRTSLVAPLACVLLFAASIAGSTGDRFAALAPVLHFVPGVGFDPRLPLVLYRLAFLIMVCVAGAWAAAGLLRRHRAGMPPAARALLPLLAPALLIVPPMLVKPALYSVQLAPPAVCETQDRVEYCVHEGHRSQLTMMVETTRNVFTTFGSNGPVRRVYDQSLMGTGVDALWFTVEPDVPIESGRDTVAAILAGQFSCDPENLPGRAAAEAVAGWLTHAGEPPQGFAFHGVPAERVRAWLADNRASVESCTLTLDGAPR